MYTDRRQFLRSALLVSAAASVSPHLRALGKSQRASVLDFGADPSGLNDSSAAVRKAIASLLPNNARIVFPAGKYLLRTDREANGDALLHFRDFQGIEIYANNAELTFAGAGNGFAFQSCRQVALHDMKLRWSDLPPNPPTLQKAIGLSFEDCDDVLLEGLSVSRVPGSGLVAQGSRDLKLDGISIAPVQQNGIAVPGDAVSLIDCRGDIQIRGSRFAGVDGDAVRIHQTLWKISKKLDPSALLIEASTPLPTWRMPQAGDFVQLIAPQTLMLMGEISVSSVTPSPGGARLEFSETLSPAVTPGMLLCSVLSSPHTTVDHCEFSKIRGRGLVVHRRTDILNNHFEDCAGPAILLAPDANQLEGPLVQNVAIRTNTFTDCNRSPGHGRGVITIDTALERSTDETPSATVNSGVKIQGNTFADAGGPAVFAAGLDGLIVEGNRFNGKTSSREKNAGAAVILRRVADASITGNIAAFPQSIVMTACEDTVTTDGNLLLTAKKTV